MGQRGPAPMPAAARRARGDTRHIGRNKLAHLDDQSPCPPDGEPTFPPGLSAAARREWKRLVPQLLATDGLLKQIDGDALAGYCEDLVEVRYLRSEVQRLRAAVAKAAKEPPQDGTQPPSEAPVLPLLKQIGIIEARCIQHRREFGMSPSARTRVKVISADKKPKGVFASLAEESKRPN